MTEKKLKLRCWHIPQVPMRPFRVEVESVREAMLVLSTLRCYDDFQFENNIKPDYSNAQGLEYFDETEADWFEWHDDNDRDICELIRD